MATSQLQFSQGLSTSVAKNAFGDTTRHATDFALPLTASMVSTKSTSPEPANKIDVATLAALANMADSRKTVVFHPPPPRAAKRADQTTNQERQNCESHESSQRERVSPPILHSRQFARFAVNSLFTPPKGSTPSYRPPTAAATPPPICRRHRKLSPGASLRTSKPQTTCDLCRLERISRQKSSPSSQ
jgi:hypothetical protein